MRVDDLSDVVSLHEKLARGVTALAAATKGNFDLIAKAARQALEAEDDELVQQRLGLIQEIAEKASDQLKELEVPDNED